MRDGERERVGVVDGEGPARRVGAAVRVRRVADQGDARAEDPGLQRRRDREVGVEAEVGRCFC